MVRILAPVLVLLSLLSAAGLIAFSSHLLLWRKEGEQRWVAGRWEAHWTKDLAETCSSPSSPGKTLWVSACLSEMWASGAMASLLKEPQGNQH